jgi:hypothetical protein
MTRTQLHAEDLIGRAVRAGNNRRVGRIEELRAETGADGCHVLAFVIGVAGLYERLGVGTRLLLGRHRGGCVARWDQLDLSDPRHPRLTVPFEELERVER